MTDMIENNRERDFLWVQISEMPYFRGLLRSVEARVYQDLTLVSPVLDLGCGDGHFASRTFNKPIEVGIDPWTGPSKQAAVSGAYGQVLQAEGASIPFPDHSFNTIISNSVLEHIPDVDAVIAEAARIIAPGGQFIFCVPNHQFLSNLSVSNFFDRIHLKFLADWYRSFFNKISRHHHCDDPETWIKRLRENGFTVEKYWHYFSKGAFHTLEWGHYFGLPSLISHSLFGKWVLVPTRWSLWLTEKICRKYYNEPRVQAEGAYTFYITRKDG